VANIAESEGYAGNGDGDGEESGSYRPAQSLCPVEELLARCNVPANLKMHGKSAYENCDIVNMIMNIGTQYTLTPDRH
jgi:hypothetical protein